MSAESELIWRFAPYDAAYYEAFDKREADEAAKREKLEVDLFPNPNQTRRRRQGFRDGATVEGVFPVANLTEDIKGYDRNDPDIRLNTKMGEHVLNGLITFKPDGLLLRQNGKKTSLWVPAGTLPIESAYVDKHFVRRGIKLEGAIFIGKATHVPQPKPKEAVIALPPHYSA